MDGMDRLTMFHLKFFFCDCLPVADCGDSYL